MEVVLKPAQIPYRETIKKKVEVQGKHKKQSGGAGQYGDVWLRIEPYEEDDFLFAEEVFGGAVPKNYFPAVEKGVREAMSQGILAGYPLGNIKVTLYDGSYHPVDSNEMAFKIAASTGFKKGAEQASPVLLEPIMDMRITVPDAYMGDVMGDLNSKRGRILGMEPTPDHKLQVIQAQAPMSEVQKYVIDLKAMTQGRGKFTMTIDHYEEVPAKIAETDGFSIAQIFSGTFSSSGFLTGESFFIASFRFGQRHHPLMPYSLSLPTLSTGNPNRFV